MKGTANLRDRLNFPPILAHDPRRVVNFRLLLVVLAGLALPGLRAADAPASPEIRKLFVKNCAPCHGEDGRARSPAARKLGVKDLTQNKLTDEQIRTQILEGVQTKGSSAKMPAFKDKFSGDEITGLIGIVKRFRR